MEMELAVLKRAVNDRQWWLLVFDSGRRRAVSRLKSAGAVVSNLGARREGSRSFGGFGAKPSLYLGSGRPRLLHPGVVEMMGSWVSNTHGHAGF